jgi:hypothetical protein
MKLAEGVPIIGLSQVLAKYLKSRRSFESDHIIMGDGEWRCGRGRHDGRSHYSTKVAERRRHSSFELEMWALKGRQRATDGCLGRW